MKQEIEALLKLLDGDSTTFDRLESSLTLLKGINSTIDKKIEQALLPLKNLRNLQEGDVIELTAENLPERDEKEKRRKRALLLLLKSIRELRSEIERVQKEWDRQKKGEQGGVESLGKIAAFAKGPFGIITLAAVLAVAGLLFLNKGRGQNQSSVASASPTPSPLTTPTPTPSPRTSPSPISGESILVITYDGAKIPLSQLAVRTGPDCTNSPDEAPHYHAANGHYVTALDGTQIDDPGGCAFGKVSETKVEEISSPENASPAQSGQTVF